MILRLPLRALSRDDPLYGDALQCSVVFGRCRLDLIELLCAINCIHTSFHKRDAQPQAGDESGRTQRGGSAPDRASEPALDGTRSSPRV